MYVKQTEEARIKRKDKTGKVSATIRSSPFLQPLAVAASNQLHHYPAIPYDDRFAPVDPVTGRKGDTPPMLGTQPRRSLDTQLTYMFVKWAGVSFEHTYGSLPPAFEKTGNTFKVGLTFTLKETSFGRYSILRP